VQAAASDKTHVVEAIQDLASDIRTQLGDTTPESAREQQRETYTAASLEAARAYELAQDLAAARKEKEAVALYQAAISYDPNFGRAYASWATAAYRLGERQEAEELWNKAMALMGRMTERERYRTLGTYYLGVARNYEMAIEIYQALLQRFPTDGAGLNSLGVAYFYTLDVPKAMEQARRAVAVYPKNGLYRTNLALYAMYAGDFANAHKEAEAALALGAGFEKAYWCRRSRRSPSQAGRGEAGLREDGTTGSRGLRCRRSVSPIKDAPGTLLDAAAVIGRPRRPAAAGPDAIALSAALLGEVYLARPEPRRKPRATPWPRIARTPSSRPPACCCDRVRIARLVSWPMSSISRPRNRAAPTPG
jgi:tetratricopeptide (TPR) repeat protein